MSEAAECSGQGINCGAGDPKQKYFVALSKQIKKIKKKRRKKKGGNDLNYL